MGYKTVSPCLVVRQVVKPRDWHAHVMVVQVVAVRLVC